MPEQTPRYRFRGNVKPTAEVKRPVTAYRNATGDTGSGGGKKPTSATIDIFDVIDSWGGWWGISAGEVDAALAKVGKVDTLYVRVNSPGGEATEGVAIANLLRAHAAEIRTTVYGLAASAASYISTAGDVVSMAPGSMLMIHEASNVIYGNADDLRAEAGVLDQLNESIASLYALKAGGTTETWRGLMHAETWYTADAAVEAKLAEQVGIDVAPGTPVMPEEADDTPDIEVDVTVEVTPAARAAQHFDLSIFRRVPDAIAAAPAAPKTPAEPPEKHPSKEGAVAMTETEIKALRERLGLAEDADVSAINAKLDELEEQATAPSDPEVTEEAAVAALAKAKGVDADAVKAAVDGAKTGKVVVSETLLEELTANAKLGAEARAKQLKADRDEAIEAAFRAGKISAERRDTWRNAWDKDPEGTKADLDSLEARFPVGQPSGYAGHDGTADAGVAMNDDEAGQLAQLAGVSKEALING